MPLLFFVAVPTFSHVVLPLFLRCIPGNFSLVTNEKRVISGGGDGRVRVWSVTSSHQAMATSWKEHRGAVTCIQVRQPQLAANTVVLTRAPSWPVQLLRTCRMPDSQLLAAADVAVTPL